MLTKPFKPLALAFLVNLIISVEDKIKYKGLGCNGLINPLDPVQTLVYIYTAFWFITRSSGLRLNQM